MLTPGAVHQCWWSSRYFHDSVRLEHILCETRREENWTWIEIGFRHKRWIFFFRWYFSLFVDSFICVQSVICSALALLPCGNRKKPFPFQLLTCPVLTTQHTHLSVCPNRHFLFGFPLRCAKLVPAMMRADLSKWWIARNRWTLGGFLQLITIRCNRKRAFYACR